MPINILAYLFTSVLIIQFVNVKLTDETLSVEGGIFKERNHKH